MNIWRFYFTCLFTVLSCWWFLSSFVFFLISLRSFLFFSKPGFELSSSRFAPLRNSRVFIGRSWLISAALKKWIIYPLPILSALGVFSQISRVRCNSCLLFSPLWHFPSLKVKRSFWRSFHKTKNSSYFDIYRLKRGSNWKNRKYWFRKRTKWEDAFVTVTPVFHSRQQGWDRCL